MLGIGTLSFLVAVTGREAKLFLRDLEEHKVWLSSIVFSSSFLGGSGVAKYIVGVYYKPALPCIVNISLNRLFIVIF